MTARSRFRYWADKLAVEAEPGLTPTQLMVKPPPPLSSSLPSDR